MIFLKEKKLNNKQKWFGNLFPGPLRAWEEATKPFLFVIFWLSEKQRQGDVLNFAYTWDLLIDVWMKVLAGLTQGVLCKCWS